MRDTRVTVSNFSNRWFNDVRASYRVHRDKAVTCSDYNLTMAELDEVLRAPSYARYLELRQRQTNRPAHRHV